MLLIRQIGTVGDLLPEKIGILVAQGRYTTAGLAARDGPAGQVADLLEAEGSGVERGLWLRGNYNDTSVRICHSELPFLIALCGCSC